MFVIQYDGDLPRTRGLDRLECYPTLEAAFARLKELFVDAAKPDGFGDPWFPDPEDDRVLVWQAKPGCTPSMEVVWAFIGSHWSWEGLPGLATANSDIPGVGSLMTLAYS